MIRDESKEDLSVKMALTLSAGILFFISCMSKVSWSSVDLYSYRFHPLHLFDSSETPDFAFVISEDLSHSRTVLIDSGITSQ